MIGPLDAVSSASGRSGPSSAEAGGPSGNSIGHSAVPSVTEEGADLSLAVSVEESAGFVSRPACFVNSDRSRHFGVMSLGGVEGYT